MTSAVLRVVALAALLAVAAPVAAAPTVVIRTHADVALRSVRRLDDGQVAVRGVLTDRATSEGLGGQPVAVAVGGVTRAAITSPDGSFEVVLEAPPGPVDVNLRFSGSSGIDAVAIDAADVDPTKAPVDLTLTANVTPLGVQVTVNAASDGVRVTLPVTLHITPADADEPHKDVPATTGTPTMVKRADALGAGARRLTARFAGDAGHGAATATTVIQLASETRTELAFTDDDVAYDATVRARGKVVDADGSGLARVSVTLIGDDKRRLGSAVTGADGRFAIDVEADLLGTGRHGLYAAAETREAYLRPSQSDARFVTVGAPQPAPVAITIAAFAATALTALGFILARRRREQRVAAPEHAEATRVAEEPRGGLEHGRPGLVSTLRRASDHGFAGLVRDSARSRPIAGATVLLSLGGEARRTDSGPDGRFALEALPAGEWSARVLAPGHVAERFTVTIPHRGELRGVRIDLVPVREKVFSIYRSAALPLLPRPELWGIWSPRQIVDHVRTHRPPPALTALTALVEEVYFSARVSEEEIIATAEARAAAAVAERAGGIAAGGSRPATP